MSEASTSLPPMYPVFLKLAGERCVVVGGGRIGCQKAAELLEAGAQVVVISPDFHASFGELGDRVERVERPWRSGDLGGARVVFSATGNSAVDEQVFAEGRAAGALVNVVDVVDRCDFYAGSVVRRGPVVVAISTSGASPSLAIALKRRIGVLVGEGHGVLARALGEARPALLSRYPVYGERARRLGAFVEGMMERCDGDAAQRGVERLLRCARPCGDGAACLCALEEGA